jgi:hypothetical protein
MLQSKTQPGQTLSTIPSGTHLSRRRRGSTLLVVVALMGMLALLGVMFFSFASQEAENAKNYQKAAEIVHDPELGPDIYFDWALRQLSVGPATRERNSALWGGRHSLLPNAYGIDAHPHTGFGYRLASDFTTANGSTSRGLTTYVDQDGDGTPDFVDADQNDLQDYLQINLSPAANVIVQDPLDSTLNLGFQFRPETFPAPDVDYTYPDINNTYLAFKSTILIDESVLGVDQNGNGMIDAQPYETTLIKPSFLRPELLFRKQVGTANEDTTAPFGVWDPATEDANENGFFDIEDFDYTGSSDGTARFDPTWYWGEWSKSLVLRPHPEHWHAHADPRIAPTVRRFLNDNTAADAAIIKGLPGGSKGFPFAGRRQTISPFAHEASIGEGAWRAQGHGLAHEFDVDADGDNIYEAILMDLDFPVQERPSDGALYIPLFGITVYDADGLINLNTAGNLAGDTSPPGLTGYFGDGQGFNSTVLSGKYPVYDLGQSKSISKSFQGVSPFEINPAWALDADPATATITPDYFKYFGRSPDDDTNPGDRWELANMEMWWLNKGRIEFGGTDQIIAGRMGEANRVYFVLQESINDGVKPIELNDPLYAVSGFGPGANLFPFPGVWNRDDNRNSNEGGMLNSAGGQTAAFEHPISFSGRGRFTPFGDPKNLDMRQASGTGSPSSWLRYFGFDVAGTVRRYNHFGHALMPSFATAHRADSTAIGTNYQTRFPGPDGVFAANPAMNLEDDEQFLANDLLEMSFEDRSIKRPTDEIFTAADAAILHLSKSHIDLAGVHSRLTDLMPANINPADATVEANDRRRRFTPISWDRKQFNFPRILHPGLGAGAQPGNTGVDDDRNGVIDDLTELGWPGSDDLRAWEVSADVDGDGRLEFPPAGFAAGGTNVEAYAGYHPNAPFTITSIGEAVNPAGTYSPDPFRPQLRRILEVEVGNRDELKLQFKLGINQLLDVVRSNNGAAHPYYSPLTYRPLTPHPTDDALNGIKTLNLNESVPELPPRNDRDREFWARYDRQRMARDIYVMLYTFCGGNDAHDYRLPNGTAGHNDEELQRMAQFAVNVVDSLDSDSAISMFEFDTDLSDGWGLDDQPWDTAEDPDPGDRQVVYGVEAQQLTFSETLWVFQEQYTGAATDNDQTLYDETIQDHHFLYMELRNTSPEDVELFASGVTTDHDTATWRIRRKVANGHESVEKSILNGDVPAGDQLFYFKDDSANSIGTGDLFTIATGDNYSGGEQSSLYVDSDVDGEYELIVPNEVAPTIMDQAGLPVTPWADLDLIDSDMVTTRRFELVDSTSSDDFLSATTAPAPGSDRLAIILERRMNPALPNLPVSLNPWVTVDIAYADRTEFDLRTNDDTQAAVETKLQNLESLERVDPLHGFTRDSDGNGSDTKRNSIGRNNFTANASSDLFATTLDRNFTSTIDLLNVSVNGPDFQTRSILGALSPAYHQMGGHDKLFGNNGPASASALFLMPSPPNQSEPDIDDSTNWNRCGPAGVTTGGSLKRRFKNHWHRLLGFVEVPTRTHIQLGGPFATTRVPGRLNLNTIRHPEVLAALLDDPELFLPTDRPNDVFGLPGSVGLGTNENDGLRDWWFDLLASRDGLHPETNLALPGMPYSRPFRDIGVMADISTLPEPNSTNPDNNSPIEDTILRSHPDLDAPRGLFDLGNADDAERYAGDNGGSGSGVAIDQFNRRRLLSKILGNTTNRSNVFFVFVSVQFHEAYEDPTTGSVRIGGRIDLNSDGRRDDGHQGFFVIDRSAAEEAYNPKTGTFDWKELLKYRLTIN